MCCEDSSCRPSNFIVHCPSRTISNRYCWPFKLQGSPSPSRPTSFSFCFLSLSRSGIGFASSASFTSFLVLEAQLTRVDLGDFLSHLVDKLLQSAHGGTGPLLVPPQVVGDQVATFCSGRSFICLFFFPRETTEGSVRSRGCTKRLRREDVTRVSMDGRSLTSDIWDTE